VAPEALFSPSRAGLGLPRGCQIGLSGRADLPSLSSCPCPCWPSGLGPSGTGGGGGGAGGAEPLPLAVSRDELGSEVMLKPVEGQEGIQTEQCDVDAAWRQPFCEQAAVLQLNSKARQELPPAARIADREFLQKQNSLPLSALLISTS